MAIIQTIKVTDGKTFAIINESDAADWATRGFVKDAEETKPPADDGEKPAGRARSPSAPSEKGRARPRVEPSVEGRQDS